MTPEEIQEQLAKLETLTPAELTALDEAIVAQIEANAEEDSDDALALMTRYAEELDKIRAEVSEREKKAAERKEARDKILAKVKPAETEEVAQPEAEAKDDEKETEEEEAKPAEVTEIKTEVKETPAEKPEAKEEAKQPIAAAAVPTLAELAAKRPPAAKPQPKKGQLMNIVAGADLQGVSAGSSFKSEEEIGQHFFKMAWDLDGSSFRGKKYIASFETAVPDSRSLTADARSNMQKIEPLQQAMRHAESPVQLQALTASGGICGPVGTRYDRPDVSTTRRPVRDSLVSMNADRGGVNVFGAVTFADVTSGVTVRTEAEDEANSPLKACVTINCASPTEVLVATISQCAKIGNLQRRTWPENWNAWWNKLKAVHAQTAENRLLTRMGTLSTNVSTGQVLGAARDWFENLAQAGSAYRDELYMDDDAVLDVWAPRRLFRMIQADLIRQMPGDNTLRNEALSRQAINGVLNALNVRVTWFRGGESGQTPAIETGGHLNAWNTTVVWYMAHPGAFLFVDGGSLDLGLEIRDMDLIASNDVAGFSETFEEVAFIGEKALRISSVMCPDGSSAALQDTATVCTAGS